MLCNMVRDPLLTRCCHDKAGSEEITLVSFSGDSGQFGNQIAEGSVLIHQPYGDGEVQLLDVSGNLSSEDKLDMSYQIQEERASHILLRDPNRPRPMPPIKEGFGPVSSYQAFAVSEHIDDMSQDVHSSIASQLQQLSQDVHGRSGVALPESESWSVRASGTPRGDFLISDAAEVGKVTGHEMMNMEQMVSRMAGSPLGCINFEDTFRSRQQNNQILTLRSHSFEGMAFGDVAEKHQKVTMLALKNAEGRVLWAPAPYIRLHSSDEILLIDCTPFAMAMGLTRDASLSASALTPSSTPPVTDRSFFAPSSGRVGEGKPRRCCV